MPGGPFFFPHHLFCQFRVGCKVLGSFFLAVILLRRIFLVVTFWNIQEHEKRHGMFFFLLFWPRSCAIAQFILVFFSLLLCSCYIQHHSSVNQLIKPEFVSLCTQVALISSCLWYTIHRLLHFGFSWLYVYFYAVLLCTMRFARIPC